MCCVGPATFAGTVLTHRTRRNAGDGVPYADCWTMLHSTGPSFNKHVIPRPKAVGISRHRSGECYIPAGDCHVACRLLAMTVVADGWFHRCGAVVRSRCGHGACAPNPKERRGRRSLRCVLDNAAWYRTAFQRACHSEAEGRGNLPAPQCRLQHSRRRLPRRLAAPRNDSGGWWLVP